MSAEQIKAFGNKVQESKELQESLRQFSSLSESEMKAALVKLAAEQGFSFTVAEIDQFGQEMADSARKQGELSEEQLEAVAGGGWGSWTLTSVISAGSTCVLSASWRSTDSCPMDQDSF